MGLFDKLFGRKTAREAGLAAEGKGIAANAGDAAGSSPKRPQTSSEDVVEQMVMLADMAMDEGNYELAVKHYRSALQLAPNATAQYNLGSLYAQGKGVAQDFMEGAYWFRQAELAGEEQAGKLCLKCAMDFIHQNFAAKDPEQLYTDMMRFIKRVYPESGDANLEACRKLYAIAGNHFNGKEYAAAAKLFRAAAEFGSDGYAQNSLAVLYNAGAGLGKNDLAALYWFDKAVDNGAADVARQDRDGMLNAYRANFTPAEFYAEMLRLSGWCAVGSGDVPKDAAKSAYWRQIGEDRAREAAEKKE